MVAATVTVLTPTALAPSVAAVRAGGPPVGPFKISPLGHARLCWEAWGNGSPITLEPCDTTLQGQEWTFTGSGVLMNGNGYCLRRGGAARPGSPAADPVYLSFSGQCAGSSRQDWMFTGPSDSIENPPAHMCASVQGGALVPGATIVARRCARAASWAAWSQGVSDLALSGPRGVTGAKHQSGPAGAGARRAFTAKVTVSNGAKAMTAYAASVVLRLPAGLTATKLAGTGALSDWACSVPALACRGNLPGSSTGSVNVTGTVASRAGPARNPVTAHATVAGTNQAPHARLTATVPVSTYPMPTAAAAPAGSSHGTPAGSIMTFVVIVVILLLTGGLFLAVTTRRRQHSPAP